jgi:superfamily II DNA or RNA helicase
MFKLDLVNNELVFKEIENRRRFSEALQQIKGVKYRDVYGTFYVSLEYLDDVRDALQSFKPFRVTKIYESFAKLFIATKEPIQIDWWPCSCLIKGAGVPWKEIVPITRYFNKAAFNSKAYEKKYWDGHNHLFDVVKGIFPSGLLQRIVNILKAKDISFEVRQHFTFPTKKFTWNPTFSFTPTADQIAAVDALSRANQGIAKLPTGFGKTSFVAASLIAEKGVKSLFLANQRVLIYDAKRDFEDVFGDEKIGIIGDGEFELENITVASIQGIVAGLKTPERAEYEKLELQLSFAIAANDKKQISKLEKKKIKLQEKTERAKRLSSYLEEVDLFIVDESQVLGTDMWNTFLTVCPAPYRYTLSATDTRGDGGRILIVAATGERVFESSASEQIEKGRLAEFKGKFKKFDHGIPKHLAKNMKFSFHQAYDLFIMRNDKRNDHLCDVVKSYAKEGHSVIALVTRIDHADIIQRTLLQKGFSQDDCRIVTGVTSKKEREQLIEDFRAGVFPVLIGSSIFDVGFNAKNAARMVRFNAGGSEVREPQRAGRTVRMREDGSHGETYDVYDQNVPFFEFQSKKRVKALRDEFGNHRVEILKGTIEGTLNISDIREVAQQIPDKTDKAVTEAIIKELSTHQKAERPEPTPVSVDSDLKNLLDNLGLW